MTLLRLGAVTMASPLHRMTLQRMGAVTMASPLHRMTLLRMGAVTMASPLHRMALQRMGAVTNNVKYIEWHVVEITALGRNVVLEVRNRSNQTKPKPY